MIRRISLRILAIIWFVSLFISHTSAAVEKEPVALKVLPENVGVFVEVGKQQFQAIAIFADGSEKDYTDKVGWSLEKYPFSEQTMAPNEVATIDRKGLATVVSTWGRVKVVATYPPPDSFTPSVISMLLLSPPPPVEPPKPRFPFLPGILSLLLSSERIDEVYADNGPLGGGNVVTITGKNISDGSDGDIETVTLNGVRAKIISFDNTTVRLVAGRAQRAGLGEVVVESKSHGRKTKRNGYAYTDSGAVGQHIAPVRDLVPFKRTAHPFN